MKRYERARERGGFVLPMVLLMILVASLFLTAAFERRGMQALMEARQLRSYKVHHELYGVRAITLHWMRDSETELDELVGGEEEDDDADYGFVLPGGAEVRVYVQDGQGRALIPESSDSLDESMRDIYLDVLDRIGWEDPGLYRRVGSAQISVNGAPREVLEALVVEEGDAFADRVLQRRGRQMIDRDEMQRIMRSRGLDEDEMADVFRVVTFEPGLLRLDIRVKGDGEERRFNMLVDQPAGTTVNVHEWNEVRGGNADEDDSDRRGPGRRRS